MVLGGKLNKWMESKQMRSSSHQLRPNEPDRVVCFTKMELGKAFNWAGRDWRVFTSLRRMFQVSTAAFFMSLSELNSFLLINAFGIANNTSLCVILRISIIGLIAIPAGAELFAYIEECDMRGKDSVVRLGPSLWMLFWTTLLEVAVAVKFFPHHMRAEIDKTGNVTGIPYGVLVPLCISFVFTLLWIILRYDVLGSQSMESHRKSRTHQNGGAKLQTQDCLVFFSMLPIVYLFIIGWKWD